MAWNLAGTYFETCSCDTPCPCIASFDLGADRDYCRLLMVFNVGEGDVEGVAVGGLAAALMVDAPKVMTDGGWRVGLCISDVATDEQADALTKVFSGQLGGPPGALGPLIGEFLGVERAPFNLDEDGLTHTLTIGEGVDVSIKDIVPFGSASGEPVQYTNVFHPAGSTLTISRADRARVELFGIAYEGHTGASAAQFAWSG